MLDWAKVQGYREGENPARWKGHLDMTLPARSKVAKVEHHAALPWRELFPRRFTIGALILIGVFLGYALLLSRLNPDIFDSEFTVEDGFV